MEYTEKEKNILALMKKTDFKNISKNDFITYASKLDELRPEVAKEIIAQFPELANLLRHAMTEYKGMVDGVVASDDSSINSVYGLLDKELVESSKSRTEYIEFANKVQADLSKCLDRENLTSEEQQKIINQEFELLKMVDKKDDSIRNHEKNIADVADKKDAEKRKFNWGIFAAGSFVFLTLVSVGAAALGGKVNLKLPNKL